MAATTFQPSALNLKEALAQRQKTEEQRNKLFREKTENVASTIAEIVVTHFIATLNERISNRKIPLPTREEPLIVQYPLPFLTSWNGDVSRKSETQTELSDSLDTPTVEGDDQEELENLKKMIENGQLTDRVERFVKTKLQEYKENPENKQLRYQVSSVQGFSLCNLDKDTQSKITAWIDLHETVFIPKTEPPSSWSCILS